MSSLFNVESMKMEDADFLQNVLYYRSLDSDRETKAAATKHLRAFLGLRIGYDLYQRLSHQKEKDLLEAQLISNICEYVKKNPKASDDVKAKFIKEEITKYSEAMKQFN